MSKRRAQVTTMVLCLTGIFTLFVALMVFFTQGSQIRVTATVLSESCHPKADLATGQTETRCDATVQFITASGRRITTKITDAFPYEFYGSASFRKINLRYFSNDPTGPMKQSNYMTLTAFVLITVFAGTAALLGGWGFARADRLAARSRRKYMERYSS
jgi:hypothetical protein